MTGPTHVVIAAAATIVLAQQTEVSFPGVYGWGAIIIGSLLPDIDEPRSTASNPAGLFAKLLPRWVQNFLNAPFQALSAALRSVFGHRGATHYLIWPFVVAGFGWYFGPGWLMWLGWGYLVHLLSDWVTRVGIPALGPFYRKTFSLLPGRLRLKTGGPVEDLINTLCWIYLLYVVYVYF